MSLSFCGLKTIQIYFFFFKIDLSLAFDHVCYKLLYGFPSLGCKNVTLNMFAIIYIYIYIYIEKQTHTQGRGKWGLTQRHATTPLKPWLFFYLIINFNVMFSFWSLFYSKSVIYFHQREIAIVLFFLSLFSFSCHFIWWTKFLFLSLFRLSTHWQMSTIKPRNHWKLFILLKLIPINW